MKENLFRAFSEVYTILKYSDEEIIKKIPTKFISMIEKYKDEKYMLRIDINKSLEEQKLLGETREILALLYRDYLASEEERTKIIERNKKIINKINEKYDIEKIFDKKKKNKVIKNTELPIIVKEKWYQKILVIIKKLLKNI